MHCGCPYFSDLQHHMQSCYCVYTVINPRLSWVQYDIIMWLFREISHHTKLVLVHHANIIHMPYITGLWLWLWLWLVNCKCLLSIVHPTVFDNCIVHQSVAQPFSYCRLPHAVVPFYYKYFPFVSQNLCSIAKLQFFAKNEHFHVVGTSLNSPVECSFQI